MFCYQNVVTKTVRYPGSWVSHGHIPQLNFLNFKRQWNVLPSDFSLVFKSILLNN